MQLNSTAIPVRSLKTRVKRFFSGYRDMRGQSRLCRVPKIRNSSRDNPEVAGALLYLQEQSGPAHAELRQRILVRGRKRFSGEFEPNCCFLKRGPGELTSRL